MHRQVLAGHQTLALFDRRHDRGRDFAAVEAIDAVPRDVAQRGAQVGIPQQHARLHGRVERKGALLSHQPVGGPHEVLGKVGRDDVAIARQRRRGLQHRAQADAAKSLKESPPRLDRAWHRHAEGAACRHLVEAA